MSSLKEAKRRLVANIGTNILGVGVSLLIGIWMTPYLIRNLTIEVYGMVPLVISFIQYFNILTMSISGAVSRFVSIHLNKKEYEASNKYFNSALFSLLMFVAAMAVPVICLAIYFPVIFRVPTGVESDISWMFFYVISASFCMAIACSFQVSTFVTHRFDLNNYVIITSKLVRVAVLLLCFKYMYPSLRYFGISYFTMGAVFLTGFILMSRVLTPQLKINKKYFSLSAVREMSKMGGWIMINQLGGLLYLVVSFILINLFLGPEQLGRFGAIAQITVLMSQLGSALSNVFAPVAYDYIASNNIDALVLQIRRSTKYMALLMAFPVGLVCGLAKPLLILWLGEPFSDLHYLVWLLVGPWIVGISIRPMFSIFRGLNKVRTPAIVTLLIGVLNVLICIALMKLTDIGIYAVAFSLLLCLTGKNLFFTPVYAAIITGQRKGVFIKELLPGLAAWLLLSFSILAFSMRFDLVSLPKILYVCIVLFLIYSAVCYFALLSKEDRRFLWALVARKN